MSLRLDRFHAFARAQLPPPSVRLLEIGCGDGALARMLAADGYEVVAIDPDAPEGPMFRRVMLEAFEDDRGFDAVVASLSLHHVEDLEEAVDRVAEFLGGDGALVLQEWAKENLVGETAGWYHAQLLAREHEGVPDSLTAFLEQSEERLADVHTFAALRDALARRFDEVVAEWVPYLYSHNLDDDVEPEERALIGAGEIVATGVLYAAKVRSD